MSTLLQTIQDIARGYQHARLLQLHFPRDNGPDAILLPNTFEAIECVSKEFTYTLELLSDSATIPLKSMQGVLVTISLLLDNNEVRYFNGHVFEFGLVKNNDGVAFYRMVLKPWLSYLALRQDYYLFHHQNLLRQSQTIFDDYALIADWRQEILKPLPVITQSCQFNETDLNYLSRHWEAAGLHYRFDHTKDGHTLVLSDCTLSAEAIQGESEVAMKGRTHADEDLTISTWSPQRRIVPTAHRVASFNFKGPIPSTLGASTQHTLSYGEPVEQYEYAGTYPFKTSKQEQGHVQLRLEEFESQSKVVEGESNNANLQVGRSFTVTDHTGRPLYRDNALKNCFFLISIHHVASNNYVQQEGEPATYHNRFTCSRRDIPWRPGRGFNSVNTTMFGLQTATVVTPNGENTQCDEYGRVCVQLHWDRQGLDKGGMTTWLRCMSNWAGAQLGAEFIPRKGMEVVVACLDGNVDRMVIIGCLHNGFHLPSWALPQHAALSGIRSRELTPNSGNSNAGRSNHLILDDTNGKIQAQIKSDHLHSQLSLGHVCRIENNTGRQDERGEGFALETNGLGAVRASHGLLLSADHAAKAPGRLDARDDLLNQLELALATIKQLADLAATHHAGEANTDSAQQLVEHIKNWSREVDKNAAAIAITAPAGVALSSPHSVTTSSGSNLDMVAIQDANISTGRKIFLRAAQGLVAFAKQWGIKLIAGKGKVTIQAQDGDMEIGASKDVHVYSLETLLVQAKKLALRVDGAEIRLENGEITLSSTKPIQFNSAGFEFNSGDGANTSLPIMPHSSLNTDERTAVSGRSGKARENIPYEVRDHAGETLSVGKSMSDGATQSKITDNIIKKIAVHLKQ